MDATVTIIAPLPPAVFAVFLGALGVALVYYTTKFLLSLVTGG